ncbi:hypothetical protein GOP47_0008692 [Adiantum capillus-veneris]|uniref:Uncharacterized protein n=1 Tax=Adiantum capillus-veneris TaxID=13818 RepID=A0A9D4ZJY9_ADICA|nr:hypothetical protein GOP47_0008692 [Adiantum capillus-veneris]
MDTTYSHLSPLIGVELDYDGRLCFHMENSHGPKIYKDYSNGFAVKVEDHPSDINLAPWANFQGDRYMGRHGNMYVFIQNQDEVDNPRNHVPKELGIQEE